MLEIFDPKTDTLVFRWDIDMSYGWTGGDGELLDRHRAAQIPIRKAGLAPSEARYRLLMHNKPGRPMSMGWGQAACRSTEGMVRQSLGSTIEHSGLGGSASYLRKT